MNYKVLYTNTFKRELKRLSKKYVSLKSDFENLLEKLEKEPFQGKPLGNNCFKVRLAIKSKHKGKSGGARVIIYIRIVHNELILLTVYDKSEKSNISQKELDEIIKNKM
ncbi:type II toxin-antitoxin system RelE/ParE family toxin [Anaerophaga thermohalophila]|uniref:type II toxin-antitoxin system RelE/ParE family toxin n=1 Tax=Anaerophaga thermohalophila TaxID=177400 RepID=UPI0002E84F48|nr:type II toxin-antitoxin system RelE/ParE family toxin [Anaerophaga thermohalophila]